MIRTLRLHNFKAFKDTGDIELKPITVLAGPNSGGKSSILQSLLLLKQTLEAEEPDIDLNLDGRFLQFSGFNELTFGRPPLRSCEISYKITFETGIPPDAISVYFPDLAIGEKIEPLPLQSDIGLSFRYRVEKDGTSRVVMNHFDMNSRVRGKSGPRLTMSSHKEGYQVKLERFKLPKPYRGQKIIDAGGKHFLPAYLVLEPNPQNSEDNPTAIGVPIFNEPLRQLEHYLKKYLEYLGPLREEPRRAYLHSGNPRPEIGQRGEYAAQVLWLEKDNTVQYLPSLNQELGDVTLMEAVNDAFQHLGLNYPIDVKSEKSIVYRILFGLKAPQDKKKQITIADVGFGVSQLLPIVVMGVRAPKSSLLLFEQPEIHLHPKLQANLADFFLTLALSGKRLLIETHSDHFINRLRRRIAEEPTDTLKEQVNILFVRPPQNGQGATIEPLRVNRYGIIENWPPDFLPESANEAEAIFTAGLEKRKGRY